MNLEKENVFAEFQFDFVLQPGSVRENSRMRWQKSYQPQSITKLEISRKAILSGEDRHLPAYKYARFALNIPKSLYFYNIPQNDY